MEESKDNVEQATVTPSETSQQPSSEQDSYRERNWTAMRERQKELERNLKLQMEMNEKLMQMATQAAPKPVQEPDEFDSIGDDEYIPKGKVNKLVEKKAALIAQEIARKETEKLFQQQNQAQFMDRLKRQFSDFDDVVNPETLSLFETREPELAQSIASTKDPYSVGIQSYKYIKALGLDAEVPKARRIKEVEKKLEKNEKAVQSPQAFDKRPLAQAFKLTEAEKTTLYEEMMGFARQASSVPELMN